MNVLFLRLALSRFTNLRLIPNIQSVGCILFVTTMLSFNAAFAQSGIPYNGLVTDHDFVHDAIDSVDLDSGNLILHIPIISYKQRGTLPDFTLLARYNASTWFVTEDECSIRQPSWMITEPSEVDQQNSTQNFPSWNFLGKGIELVRGEALSTGTYDFAYTDFYNKPNDYYVGYVQDSSGAQHLMYRPTGSGQARSMDGSGIAAPGTVTGEFVNIFDSRGVAHTAAGDVNDDGFFDALRDPFGNAINPVMVSASTQNYTYQQVSHWIDSIGRHIPAPPGGNALTAPVAGCYTYQYPSTSESTSASTAPYTFCYAAVLVSSAFPTSPSCISSRNLLKKTVAPVWTKLQSRENARGAIGFRSAKL